MRSNAIAVAAALAITLGGSPSAQATTVKLLDLDELTRAATHVVAGEITGQEAAWIGRLLVTRVTLRVADCLKGPCEAGELTIHVLGGQADGLAMHVEGAATLYEGEDVLLFLQAAGAGVFRTVGMAQGKFGLTSLDPDAQASRDLSGLVLQRDGIALRPAADPVGSMRLAELRTRVLAARPDRSEHAAYAAATP